ncbi:MAG TPA: hypothetical protein PLO89_02430 [Spirochaetota bacterium]|nr:hypothetical protein [Spirochaetota bacterium]
MKEFIKIIENLEFKDGLNAEGLFVDISKLKADYEYIGLWYVRDGNDQTSITTEIYSSSEESDTPQKPQDFTEEIKENHFKANNRLKLPIKYKYLWISTRIDGERYCKLRLGEEKSGKLYLNFQLIRHKDFGFSVLKKGLFKGSQAVFIEIGSEDFSGTIDYKDAVFYLVCIEKLPPENWTLPDSVLAVENLPIFSNVAKFSDNKKYSDWFGQNPLR